MKITSRISLLLCTIIVFALSCSSEKKIGKVHYNGKNYKIKQGMISGMSYVMLVGHGKNKYPLTIDFRYDKKPFFMVKTTIEENKNVTWYCVTDTTNSMFKSFGALLLNGETTDKRIFLPISTEENNILNKISDLVTVDKIRSKMQKDSVNKIIGWVKASN
jgi:outer membrane protein assembly factor BamE (lipoprotein component of BamABCDE complex)